MILLSTVKDRYDSIVKLKKGGQKTVYKVSKGDDEFVLKVVNNPEDQRVLQEIEIVRGLDILNVPRIYEAAIAMNDNDDEPVLYIIEELIDGMSMRDWLIQGNRLSLGLAFRMAESLIQLEVDLEKSGILHRDINPNNIIIMPNNDIRIIDFGLAKIVGKTSLTQSEALFGPFTPGYAPYEQIANYKSKQDTRTDLFQIGMTIYEGITGNNPFTQGACDIGEIIERSRTYIPPILKLSGDLNGMFAQYVKMLIAKHPSQRPETAEQALRYLRVIRQSIEVEE